VGLGLLAAALLAAAAAGPAERDWAAVWRRLAVVRAAALGAQTRTVGLAELTQVAEEERGTPRGALLAAHLGRLLGTGGTLTPPAGAQRPWPYAGEENWLAAEVLAPSPERAAAARRALDEQQGPVPDERVRLAFDVGVEEARALRLESARGLQEALHRRYRAIWSALDLALTDARLGDYPAADALLAEQIAAEEAAGRTAGDLWAQRGTFALGSGDEAGGRDYLGLGVARGSSDAAVVLARLDLEQGRLSEARAGFRALLQDDPLSPWTPRGWGVSLLPEPADAAWSADPLPTAGE